ncbi:Serine/threonine-protein kinase 16 [Chytridiales sp. JEL 0842]|nr:Serine/threonine-protein kinase 16 [Chytridiales sp. JEL 0842]
MNEPMGAHRESFVAKLQEMLAVLLSFLMSFLSQFQPAPIVQINNRSFAIIKQLGEGGFSFVYLVKERTPGSRADELYALKRIRIQLPEHETRLRSEIAAHAAVNSPHVLKLLDSAIVKKAGRPRDGLGGGGPQTEGLLLLPFCKGGTVQDLIDRTPGTEYVGLDVILRVGIDVARGLKAFHSHNPPLAFRDLKPANILLNDSHTNTPTAILMDLGSVSPARVQISSRREAMALQELCAETVTAPFRAPELFEPSSDMLVDEKTDVWALGCTVYAMAYRTSPFDGSATAAVGGKVMFPNKRDPYGNTFREMLTWILATKASERPSVDEIIVRMENMLGSLGGV